MNTYALLTNSGKLYTLAANATEDDAHYLAGLTEHTPVKIERRAVFAPDWNRQHGDNAGESRWFDRMVDLGTGETIRLM